MEEILPQSSKLQKRELEIVDEYAKKWTRLVQQEREEEMERFLYEVKKISGIERQKRGRALLSLHFKEIEELEEGYLLYFYQEIGDYLLRTEFSPGDQVILSTGNPLVEDRNLCTVVQQTRTEIVLFFKDKPEEWLFQGTLRLDFYLQDEMYKEIFSTLKSLKGSFNENSRLTSILLGLKKPGPFNQEGVSSFFDVKLNSSQQEAVDRSLQAQDLFLIEGGPGTGKTRVLLEIIRQGVKRGLTFLVTTATLDAGKIFLKDLQKLGIEAALVGFPFVGEGDLYSLLKDTLIYREIVEKKERLSFFKEKEEENKIVEELKILQKKAIQEVLEKTRVLCTTTTHCHCEILSSLSFHVLVMDDANYSMEPLALLPIQKVSKMIMAGDSRSASPGFLSIQDQGDGLSLYKRFYNLYGQDYSLRLRYQYRMHEVISSFLQETSYQGNLETSRDSSSKTHFEGSPLKSPGFLAVSNKTPLLFFDTSTMQGVEYSWENHQFCENPLEADLVIEIVSSFLDLGFHPSTIAVISPYPQQSNLIRKTLGLKELWVNVPQFSQGQEKDLVVLSFVRSNKKGYLGLLKDIPNINRALSRAKERLIMVGNSKTLSCHPFYKSLLQHVKENGYFYHL